jgi:predicted DNA binding CopG/RHH family protein
MKNKRPVQYFTKEYLEQVKYATPEQIVHYLEESKRIYYASMQSDKAQNSDESVLISLRVPRDLLEAFKAKAELHNTKYQTLIKQLMKKHLSGK